MSAVMSHPVIMKVRSRIPEPFLVGLRGVGQVFFQENALTGALFVLGIAMGSPLMAVGAVLGTAIGTATARALRFDEGETTAGIYGFNATLVGVASLFFLKLSAITLALLVVGCVVSTILTRLVRRHVPFPTYTAPFIVTTWVIVLVGPAIGAAQVEPGPPISAGFVTAVAHGVGQVMFQASIWTALLFLVGIAINDREHAAWTVVGSVVGLLVALYHHDTPEEAAALGLYGYNAALTAIAVFLWRRSLIPPLLGILLSVPLTEHFPIPGVPALTAPFVLATWVVLTLGWVEAKFLRTRSHEVT
ncbi:MAG: urea transporter [Isosphaeraceae bacterium]